MTDEKFQKPYKLDKQKSAEIYEKWEKTGLFNPDNAPKSSTKVWSTIMPPPNANGRLHAGHGLDLTIKDVIGRYMRMNNHKVLLLPGADHAGFETQIVYEKKLEKEGRSRFNMDPKQLFDEINTFTLESKKFMEDDVRRMGISCDWSREKFTIDPDIISRVQDTFIKMHEDKLVYKGKRICNWCTKHQTSLSDVETEYEERKDPFYYLQFGPFVIGTSRPETKFGDKCIVVHPDDKRYAEFKHGQTLQVDWINGPITATVIKDPVIDMTLGTGAMTITPWHSDVDFDIAQRHNLPYEQVIDERGKLLPIAGQFAGEKIIPAREKLVAFLKEKGLLVKVDDKYVHNVKVCYKCQTIIEPQIKDQWFVKMEKLAKAALDASVNGDVTFVSDQFRKVFEYWMSNPMDWNISRQIVWGISIPVWYKNKGTAGEEIFVGKDMPGGSGWVKETDTFDTWFSSGQWPLLTLGFPEGEDFKNFYPTDFMETGRDLIFKWIPRMVMFGLYLAGKVPFKTIYLHGMVNDAQNQKMSKSKGNVMSPIDLADEFGVDALRMALLVGNTPGNDMALSKDKIHAYAKFANKVWNIARFVLDNTDEKSNTKVIIIPTHQAFFAEIESKIKETATHIEKYELHLASEKIYHLIWHYFADIVIEELKQQLNDSSLADDSLIKKSARYTLRMSFMELLKALHPFMPFLTEEIWQSFSKDELMLANWNTISTK